MLGKVTSSIRLVEVRYSQGPNEMCREPHVPFSASSSPAISALANVSPQLAHGHFWVFIATTRLPRAAGLIK